MQAFREGDSGAARELADLFYPELRRLAASRMKGERTAHTWQPTALVHELYLELVKIRAFQSDSASNDRAAFLAIAGHLMKRLLIHHARPLRRRTEHEPISDEEPRLQASVESLHDVEDALARLAEIDPRLRTVVEMKVFEQRTGDEIAASLNCSRGTVHNWWNFARKWLETEWASPRAASGNPPPA